MSTDKTWFDDRLKAKLQLDLAFRLVVGACISTVAAVTAYAQGLVTGIDYLKRVSDSAMPVMNVVGTLAIVLCFVALMFKDAQEVGGKPWGYDSRIGKFGGFFRRLAADLSLWVVGALVLLLSSVVVAAGFEVHADRMTAKGAAALGFLFLFLVAALLVVGVLNVLVRRPIALLTLGDVGRKWLSSPLRVCLLYGVFVVGMLARIWI